MNRYHRWYCGSPRWSKRLQETVLPWVIRDADLGPRLLEIGPGPGMATGVLRTRVEDLTCIEIDPGLAAKLRARMDGTNVTVVEGDAARMPFEDGEFDSVICMTMLHHVPEAKLQDQLLREACRVLKPGSIFYGSDSTPSFRWRLYHLFDTCVPVDPLGFEARLKAAGFEDAAVRTGNGAFRWTARKPG